MVGPMELSILGSSIKLQPTGQVLLPPILKPCGLRAFNAGERKRDSGSPGDAERVLS